ncbi:FlgN protein [Treponema socranskii subsp. socranskii VPI DR56BR1116 = ATCC 35536]|uniref:FlgN protein n=1 Tax=Treponema socranskii subsp. socranskii VPI DR56BR1116 = ATCC 35536 TaxID=1125725 RepID=A0ABN0P8U2_TRESO|nr:FlgN protein [Treponema socranskii]ERK04905.1 FlgN protein [Treponema socranskii subsp. socranskii VPI DR56BR1116 = ATCC 35536]
MADISEMERLLLRENEILDRLLERQSALRAAVLQKKWDGVLESISAITKLTEAFEETEKARNALSAARSDEAKKASLPLLTQVRGKLVKSKTANKTLGNYIAVARDFIQSVLDEAFPQSGAMVYSKAGKIMRAKPSSVVVNTLY